MKKIDLRMNEQQKYEVIKSLIDHNRNKNAAALKIGCTIRTINRMIQNIHGNRGRQSAHTIFDEMVADIMNLYNNKYYDATFSYAYELLAEYNVFQRSPSALTNLMYKNFITSPRTIKTVRKRLQGQLCELQKNTKSKKKTQEL